MINIKKIIILLLVIVLGVWCGNKTSFINGHKIDKKSFAIRVEVPKKYVDYELLSLINFTSDLFKSNGYNLKGITYGGNMYPQKLDNAYVNIFVRGYAQGFDKRVSNNRFNIFLFHKTQNIYFEEFRNYDYYISIQPEIINIMNILGVKNVSKLPLGAIKRKILNPEYKKNVLYLYEFKDKDIKNILNKIGKTKIYDAFDFAQLTSDEREEELKKAKIVLYVANLTAQKDAPYIPYAVLDIASYGRPVITNFYKYNNKNNEFLDIIETYSDIISLESKLNNMLKLSDKDREEHAKKIRKLLHKQNYKSDIFSKIIK